MLLVIQNIFSYEMQGLIKYKLNNEKRRIINKM